MESYCWRNRGCTGQGQGPEETHKLCEGTPALWAAREGLPSILLLLNVEGLRGAFPLDGREVRLLLTVLEDFLPSSPSLWGKRPREESQEGELGHKAPPHLSVGGIAHARDEVLCHLESCLPLLLVSFSPWINRKGIFCFLRAGILSSSHSIFSRKFKGRSIEQPATF